jgi:hypothetical protein
MRVEMKAFEIDGADVALNLRSDGDLLQEVRSSERGEPLRNTSQRHGQVTTGVNSYRSNTLKGDTTAVPDDTLGQNSANGLFTVWQPHFDREFASTGELLNIPVYPPSLLTQRLNFSRRAPYQQLGSATPHVLNAAGAAALFLWPDWTPDRTSPDDALADDNRWYRLFQFVEVPSRVNRMLGNYVSLKRVPGKLNPNMIRDREIYAGLLDDTQFLNTNPLADFNNDGNEDGPFTSGAGTFDGHDGMDPFPVAGNTVGVRDRWLEFLNERDGNVLSTIDPTPALPNSGDEENRNYWIPGTPNSRPFKTFNSRSNVDKSAASGRDDNGFESTLFRRFSMDRPEAVFDANGTQIHRANVAGEENPSYNIGTVDPAANRNWLEVGNRDYHKLAAGIAGDTSLEHHQLLSKIMNNTTTVSNTFIAYGTAAYFEVHEDATTGLIQVGGRMGLDLDGDSDPKNDAGWEQRAVFIFDRTEFFNAYDPGSGSVDWKRLVKQRVNLSSDGN